jgi:hypothetical protein
MVAALEWRVREMVAHVTGAAEEACLATDGDPAVADRLRGTRVVS